MLDKKLREGCFDDRFSRSLLIVHIGGKSVGHRLGQLNVERLHDGEISIDASILDQFIISALPPSPDRRNGFSLSYNIPGTGRDRPV
jgi:hypothetical protein